LYSFSELNQLSEGSDKGPRKIKEGRVLFGRKQGEETRMGEGRMRTREKEGAGFKND